MLNTPLRPPKQQRCYRCNKRKRLDVPAGSSGNLCKGLLSSLALLPDKGQGQEPTVVLVRTPHEEIHEHKEGHKSAEAKQALGRCRQETLSE